MAAFWHERTYHAGTKSRYDKDRSSGRVGFHLTKREADLSPSRRQEPKRAYEHLEDMRLFGFIWNSSGRILQTRKLGISNKDCGEKLFRRKDMLCPHFWDRSEDNPCPHCKQEMHVIDLTNIPSTQYTNCSQVICGDFQTLGWDIRRSPLVSDLAESQIQSIASRGSWHKIEQNRVMKYNTLSNIPKSWGSDPLCRMKKLIQEKLIDKIFPNNTYTFDKLNVLKNNGVVKEDQDPHYDYRP